VVDDEENVRLTFRQAFEDMGLAVDTAKNGREALEKVADRDYDLMILDHRMPGPDGLEVLQRLRQTAPNVPVAIVTAHGTVERAVRAVRLGAVDVLLKPIRTDALNTLVEKVLRQPPTSPDTEAYEEWIQLGTWHLRYGRTGAARHCLEEAVDHNPERSDAHTLLGILEAGENHLEKARGHFETAVELDPDATTAQLFLEHLNSGGRPLSINPSRLLPRGGDQINNGQSQTEQTKVVSNTEDSRGAPSHRVLALLDEETIASDPLPSKELVTFASLSARAHEQSELLLLTVIEVPYQLSLSQHEEAHREKVEHLKDRLAAIATELEDENLAVRPLVVLGHTKSAIVQNVIEQENAQHLVAEWRPHADDGRSAAHYEFLDELDCEVTILRPGREADLGDRQSVVALIGDTPHAPFVVRRALEWAQGSGIASLTLVNGQQVDSNARETDLRHRGQRLLWDIADRAGLEDSQYEREVVIGKDLDSALVDSARDFEVVCVGASRSSSLAESIFGTVTDRLLETLDQPVVIARGPQPSHRSFIEDLRRHLTGA